MIHNIFSTLETFKTLSGFRPGLNILLSEKTHDSSDQQTRNRAGKSSFVEIVNFLLGADITAKSLFRAPELVDAYFGMHFTLAGTPVRIERAGTPRSKLGFTRPDASTTMLTQKEWCAHLGSELFGLDPREKGSPTFRMLIPYFLRRREESGFLRPEYHSNKQQLGDQQIALMFLLDLDWTIAAEWKRLRESEKSLPHLRRAVKAGRFGGATNSNVATLRTRLIVAEDECKKLADALQRYQVHEQYGDLERESDAITAELNQLADENTLDLAHVRELDEALSSELPPSPTNLHAIYAEAGVVLSDLVTRRFEEVRRFHESVVKNRKTYLQQERSVAQQRIAARAMRQKVLSDRRGDILRILQSHGALDQFLQLQGEFSKRSADLESLRQQFLSAQELAQTAATLKQKREQLQIRLNTDFIEREERLGRAILAYETVSKRLYGDPGSMIVTPTLNGPIFDFHIHGKRSGAVTHMRTFCFDMMLMELCAERGIGPGFLIHDSHIFDGVDGRQVLEALRIGKEAAERLGFQYIVTLNEDDAFKEVRAGFNVEDYILPTRLTDAVEDGGLFGFRFG